MEQRQEVNLIIITPFTASTHKAADIRDFCLILLADLCAISIPYRKLPHHLYIEPNFKLIARFNENSSNIGTLTIATV